MAKKIVKPFKMEYNVVLWILYHLIFFVTSVYFGWYYWTNLNLSQHYSWLLVPAYVYGVIVFLNLVTGFFSAMWVWW